jgi:phosphoglycolate phosphatase-like HAD superfamily hydrolase
MPFLDRTDIELVHPDIPRGHVRYALFDFDGTLSLIREGWQSVMIPMMVEILMQTPRHESEDELRAVVTEFVERLTGEQTIYQMIRLADEVARRGRQPAAPQEYKRQYHARLWARIGGRVAALKSGRIAPDEMLVPGALEFLKALRARGVTCYLASGTDEPFVCDEAAALGIAGYFAGIYGARDDYLRATKKAVIEQIMRGHGLSGVEFVAFGDGHVEIENAKSVGGLAVGVASSEAERRGVNRWKRERLIGAGADVIVPDFREGDVLIQYFLGEK